MAVAFPRSDLGEALESDHPSVYWRSAPQIGFMTEFDVLISSPNARLDEDWPGQAKGTDLVDTLPLASGGRVVVVVEDYQIPAKTVEGIASAHATLARDRLLMAGRASSLEHRAEFESVLPDGTNHVLELRMPTLAEALKPPEGGTVLVGTPVDIPSRKPLPDRNVIVRSVKLRDRPGR